MRSHRPFSMPYKGEQGRISASNNKGKKVCAEREFTRECEMERPFLLSCNEGNT